MNRTDWFLGQPRLSGVRNGNHSNAFERKRAWAGGGSSVDYLRGVPGLSTAKARLAARKDLTASQEQMLTREIHAVCEMIRQARQRVEEGRQAEVCEGLQDVEDWDLFDPYVLLEQGN